MFNLTKDGEFLQGLSDLTGAKCGHITFLVGVFGLLLGFFPSPLQGLKELLVVADFCPLLFEALRWLGFLRMGW